MNITARFLGVVAAILLACFAIGARAQDAAGNGEPTVAQIYQAANAGNLDRANTLIEQVLKAHPNSARAHYVKAELAARQHHEDVARQELATAEKIAPGLPFAKPESVQALRNQLSNSNAAATRSQGTQTAPVQHTRQMGAGSDTAPSRGSEAARGFPWGTFAIVAAIVVIGVSVLRRRRIAPDNGGAYGNTSAAPYGQTGAGPIYPPNGGGMQQPYPPGYGPAPGPAYGQPSMGSSIARGAATGLAIGAGAVAAQEIGRRMFEHGNANAANVTNAAPLSHNENPPTLDQIDEGMRRNLNTDMGGDDFGMNDGGWDDGGGGDTGGGGGGDW